MPTLPLSPDELLTTTRSVRKRLDLTRPVPLELVRECIGVAMQAPSASNRQAWHWVVIKDESIRRVIGDCYRRAVTSYLNSSASAASLYRVDDAAHAIREGDLRTPRDAGRHPARRTDSHGTTPAIRSSQRHGNRWTTCSMSTPGDDAETR
jgi:nitroreductase